MKRLTFDRPHDLNKLHDELIAGVPALRPVMMENPPFPGAMQAVMTVEGDGETIILVVPDDADEVAIAAVIAAHAPTPLPPVPTQAEQVDQLVAQGKAAIQAAPIATDEGRALAAIFAGALDGLGAIYGTQPGEQP